MEWFKTSYIILELLIVWGILSLLTKLPQDKIFGIAGLSVPFTIVLLTLFDDLKLGTFHTVWYLLWVLIGGVIYFTVPMTYRYYLKVGQEFQKRNDARNQDDDK